MKLSVLILSFFSIFLFGQDIPKQPNIIFIFADDWGYGDLSIHNSSFVQTPNIDRMAKEGIDFQSFSVLNPVCSPSRVAVMTGQYPARHSIHGHFATVSSHMKRNMPDWLDPNVVILPKLLQQAGYKTAHFGKWHLTNTHIPDGPSPSEYGYDEFACFNVSSKYKQIHPDHSIDKAIQFITTNKDKPFFVNLWIHETHTPHYPKQEFLKNYEALDEQKQVYAAIVEEADTKIGQIMETLISLGLDKNTLVIFSSDNGPEFTGKEKELMDNSTGKGLGTYFSVGETAGLKGRKRSLFAGGTRVPFIVWWPGVVKGGVVDKTSNLSAVDLLPTFCELAGINLPENYLPDGESFVNLLLGNEFKRTKPIYWQWKFSNLQKYFWASAAIQDGKWKLYVNQKKGLMELYDLDLDWFELNNVSSQYPKIVQSLFEKIQIWEDTLPLEAPKHCFSKLRH